jgi:undecaprenyl pyrophosphate synthase
VRHKVNFLVNYGSEWDLNGLKEGGLRSADVSRIDLIVRWGGGRRLSGFLPVHLIQLRSASAFWTPMLIAKMSGENLHLQGV